MCASLATCPFPCHPNHLSTSWDRKCSGTGSAQQLQGGSPQQWCPSTTYYLSGFSSSRCYSGRNGVKLRCKEKLVSIGPLYHPLFMISLQDFSCTAQRSVVEELDFVPRVCAHSFPLGGKFKMETLNVIKADFIMRKRGCHAALRCYFYHVFLLMNIVCPVVGLVYCAQDGTYWINNSESLVHHRKSLNLWRLNKTWENLLVIRNTS